MQIKENIFIYYFLTNIGYYFVAYWIIHALHENFMTFMHQHLNFTKTIIVKTINIFIDIIKWYNYRI